MIILNVIYTWFRFDAYQVDMY